MQKTQKEFYEEDAHRIEHAQMKGVHHEVRVERFLEGLDREPAGGRWLDAPSGDGMHSKLLAERHTVVAVDLSHARLKRARMHGVSNVVRADLNALPFREGTFDGVACLQAIEHFVDPAPAMRELKRVVRAGGAVVVETPSRTNLFNIAVAPFSRVGLLPGRLLDWGLRLDPGHVHFFTERQVRDLLEGVGLRVERVVGAPVLRWNFGILEPVLRDTRPARKLERVLSRVPVLRATGMIQAFWCKG